MIYVQPHRDHVRLGVDACPGIEERGHGLTMRTLHDDGCCAEWASGRASTPARAAAFREVAARWGASWPMAGPEAAAPEPDADMAARWAEIAQPVAHGISHAVLEERRWGSGGRARFADPRPGGFPGRGAERQARRETELEAG